MMVVLFRPPLAFAPCSFLLFVVNVNVVEQPDSAFQVAEARIVLLFDATPVRQVLIFVLSSRSAAGRPCYLLLVLGRYAFDF